MTPSSFIHFDAITKTFAGVTALDGVSLSVHRGECHALMGENGAGKSTLGKILAGIHRPDAGVVRMDGQAIHFHSPRDAAKAGIGMVHQELAFCPDLSVAENLALGRYPRKLGFWVDRRAMFARARELLGQVGADIGPGVRVGSLSTAQEQLLQIAAAGGAGARVLVFDEPTSSLSQPESERLFALIARLKARGVTMIYVSHRLPEVFTLCDRLSVLRDGRLIGTLERAEATPGGIVGMMLGRAMGKNLGLGIWDLGFDQRKSDAAAKSTITNHESPVLPALTPGILAGPTPGFTPGPPTTSDKSQIPNPQSQILPAPAPARRTPEPSLALPANPTPGITTGPTATSDKSQIPNPKSPIPLLRVRDLSSPARFAHVSFDVHAGEIVGLAGLIGAGRSEVAQAIFGLDPGARGSVEVAGRPLALGSVRRAMQAGLGLVPEDRKRQGLVLMMSGRENFSLPLLDRLSRAGLLSRGRERRLARELFTRLDVRTPSLETPVAALSGGNQQKVALAKWFARECRVLLIDEPTRGVDVGAKAAIHALISALAQQGAAVLLISSELPEVLSLSRRVLVMRGGRAVGELSRDEATQDRVLGLMAGVDRAA